MNEKYLILCDLDSTLLDDKKRITKKSIRYIRKIVEEGHLFCICTGRPIQGCIKYANDLNISCPIITDNGANIYYPDANMEYDEFPIPLNDFKNLLNDIRDIIVCCAAGTRNYTFVQNRNSVPFWVLHEDSAHPIIEGVIADEIKEEPFLPSLTVIEDSRFIEAVANYSSIDYCLWGKFENGYSFDLFSKKSSKGNALLFLKNKYGIRDDRTIAFGDQLNDLSMIKNAYYGCAMINGVEKLRSEADVVTKYNNNHDGVIKELKRILKKGP